MEGKAVLFKKFANIDVMDIEVDADSIEDFVKTVKNISPTFGGINLEDIAAPRCFEIEKALKKTFPGRLGGMNIAAVKRSYDEVKEPIQAVFKFAPEEKTDLQVYGYGVLKDVSSWRVFTPEIDVNKCTGCKHCWVFCPETAINWDEATNKPSIRYNACKGCGVCANECPVNVIEMVRVEA